MKASARDRLGSILMFLFVASLWWQRNYMTPFGGIFPDIVMEILTGIVVVTLVLSFTRYAGMKDAAKGGEEKTTHWTGMIVVGGILLAWAVLLRYVGFILTGVVCFTAISLYLTVQRRDVREFSRCALVAVAVTLLLVFVFQYLLQVPLPAGTLFE